MKVLTLSSQNHPGVSAVFKNMSQIILCEHRFVEDFVVGQEIGYDLLILGAWTNQYPDILDKVKIKKAILWTSSLAQSELSPNGIETQIFNHLFNLLDEKKIHYLLLGDFRMAELWATSHSDKEKIRLFPYPISLPLDPYVEIKGPPRTVGLFTVSRPGKNILTQYYAFQYAFMFNPEIKLKTNIIKAPGEEVTFTGWLDSEQYHKAISDLDIGLNVFMAESFCYTFCELMARGIPTICSPSVAGNFDLPETLRNFLEVRDTESLLQIANKILGITKMGTEEFISFRKLCIQHIVAVAKENNQQLFNLLKELTSS